MASSLTISPAMTTTATRRSQQAPRALQGRNDRVEQYRTLVRPIALHYQRCCAEPLDDLVQVGLLGLLRAAELYRQDRQIPFEAFARPHVRGSILHYLRDQAHAVRLPRRLDEQRQQLARLQQRATRTLAPEELRGAMGLNPEQWQRLLDAHACRRPLSLDQMLDDPLSASAVDPGSSPRDDVDGPEPLQLLAGLQMEQRQVVERVVLAGWSYRRTGQALNISPMTVQRRLRRALEQLRRLLNPEADCRRAPSAAPAC
jgi:RNA polymerase sigma-B factor